MLEFLGLGSTGIDLNSLLSIGSLGLLGAGDYAINSAASKKAAKKAFKYNLYLQNQQYKYNTMLQDDAQAFSREMLGLQQDYTTRMSNTAHQRELKDLRAAGLNPILSATGGNGASSPVVSAPSASHGAVSAPAVGISPVIPSGISNSVSSAFKIAKEFQQLYEIEKEQLRTNISKSKADIKNQTKVADAQANLLDAQARTTGYRTMFGDIPLSASDKIDSAIYRAADKSPGFFRSTVDGYLKYVGKPFSAAVDSFFNHMQNSANRAGRGRDGSFKVEYDPKAEKFVYRGNYKGWKR